MIRLFRRKPKRTPISMGREAYFAAVLALDMHDWRMGGAKVWDPDGHARVRAGLVQKRDEERAKVARREGWPV